MEIALIKKEINAQLADKETFNSLLKTTFKELKPENVKTAIMEGMMRGFEFKDFLERNVYAIPFRNGYSLVTSIDYARKIGMRSGVNGKSKPVYEEKDGKVVSCTVTVYRKDGHPEGYTATVYFSEYTTGRNLWETKPRTMIAKVAEMHALRMACPEQLSQSYVEEEMQTPPKKEVAIDLGAYEQKLKDTKTIEELQTVWADMPVDAKNSLKDLKDELKKKYEVA